MFSSSKIKPVPLTYAYLVTNFVFVCFHIINHGGLDRLIAKIQLDAIIYSVQVS